MPHTALFVIDIQNDLAEDPKTRIPYAARIKSAGTAILAKARSFIDEARSSGHDPSLNIVIVQHEEDPESGPMTRGSTAWELVFEPRADDAAEKVFAKTVRDTFESNPQLADELKATGVQKIVAFGIQSEYCVLSTCKGALAAGLKVTVLKGAHSTYDIKSKKAEEIERDVEKELEGQGAEVIAWEDWEP